AVFRPAAVRRGVQAGSDPHQLLRRNTSGKRDCVARGVAPGDQDVRNRLVPALPPGAVLPGAPGDQLYPHRRREVGSRARRVPQPRRTRRAADHGRHAAHDRLQRGRPRADAQGGGLLGMRGLAGLLVLLACASAGAQTLTVGSKRFTESYVLGEIVSQTAKGTHKPGLGNTAILLEALKAGAIDLYPEYTGTIAREILKSEDRLDLAALNAKLKPLGLAASVPLGFSNSYALGMRRKDAERLGIRKVSDLPKHPALKFGLSHEFLGRRDGWPGPQGAYGLPQKPRGLDHGIAYEALAAGEIDVMDLYTTDAKIERYAIVALDDDRKFFPPYDA